MTDPKGVSRTHLMDTPLGALRTVERVEGTRIEFAPGLASGLHLHPCPVVGVVLEGSIRFQVDGQPEQILEPGDTFHEPAGAHVPHFDNASATEPAAFLAFYLLAPGETKLLEMLD